MESESGFTVEEKIRKLAEQYKKDETDDFKKNLPDSYFLSRAFNDIVLKPNQCTISIDKIDRYSPPTSFYLTFSINRSIIDE